MTDGKTKDIVATKRAQYRAINDLIDESKANGAYNTLLVLSSIIISAGLLLNNPAILIGGMLMTPLLTPILLIALGVTTSNESLLKHTAVTMLKSVGIILVISFVAGLIFNLPEGHAEYTSAIFENSLRAAFLYFLVALTSGVAATFAWVHHKADSLLPGISIAVSLVPPIAMVGIAFATAEFALLQYFLMVFLFNLFGIITGGIIIFSMLEFYRSEKTVSKKIDKVIAEEKEIKAKKEEEHEALRSE